MTRYYVEAYYDELSGNASFVDSFLYSFDVSDTIIKGDIFEKKDIYLLKIFQERIA
jgi:hypothetical protein